MARSFPGCIVVANRPAGLASTVWRVPPVRGSSRVVMPCRDKRMAGSTHGHPPRNSASISQTLSRACHDSNRGRFVPQASPCRRRASHSVRPVARCSPARFRQSSDRRSHRVMALEHEGDSVSQTHLESNRPVTCQALIRLADLASYVRFIIAQLVKRFKKSRGPANIAVVRQ
jgi:hypothetical protein